MKSQRAVALSVGQASRSSSMTFAKYSCSSDLDHSGCVFSRVGLRFGLVNSSGLEAHLATDQGVISATARTVKYTTAELMDELSSPGNKGQLMSIIGPVYGVSPRHSVVDLGC